MKLIIKEQLFGEIAHHYSSINNEKLFSLANRFWGSYNAISFDFEIPITTKTRLLKSHRLTRRISRTDKSSAAFNYSGDGIIILFLGIIYFYDLKKCVLYNFQHLKQCRNILHRGIAVTKQGVFFGEYGANENRGKVPVWGSFDDGRSWDIVYKFPEKTIKHIHGIYKDPYSNSLWIPTGDFEDECFLFEVPEKNFQLIKKHGNGKQEWRPVSLFFTKEKIIWGMDSQLKTSYLQVYDRKLMTISRGKNFPGPVWYNKTLIDGFYLLQTTVEIGPGCKSNKASIFLAQNIENWNEIINFNKDILPMKLFKFGVIAFADGRQSSKDFVFFGEALNGLDGKIYRAELK